MKKIFVFFVCLCVVFSAENVELTEEVVLENSITDYIELIKCLLANETLVNDVMDVYEIIVKQDFNQLIAAAMKLYTDGMDAVKECSERVIDDAMNLQAINSMTKRKSVEQSIKTKPFRDLCKMACTIKLPNRLIYNLCMAGCRKL